MLRLRALPLVTLVAGALVAPSAAAARDLSGTRSLAMGGTLRATHAGLAAPLLNPASMSAAKMYVLGALYQYRASDSANQLHAAIVDSITAKVAAGLFYSFTRATPTQSIAAPGGPVYTLEEKLTTHEVGLSLSVPLGSMFMIGLTGKYIDHRGEIPEDAPAGVNTPDIGQVSLDAGAVLRIIPQLHLGVVGYNLVEVGDQNFPRSMGLAASYQFGQVLLAEFDTVLDFESHPDGIKASYHGGLEAFVGKMYALRTGVLHDTLRQASYVSGGLGLVSRRVGLEFGLRQMVDGGSETLVSFSLQLFLR